jgi:hypothetical protein
MFPSIFIINIWSMQDFDNHNALCLYLPAWGLSYDDSWSQIGTSKTFTSHNCCTGISLYDVIMLPYACWMLLYTTSLGQLTFQTYLQHHKLMTLYKTKFWYSNMYITIYLPCNFIYYTYHVHYEISMFLFMVYLATLTVAQTMYHGITGSVNDKLGRILYEAIII